MVKIDEKNKEAKIIKKYVELKGKNILEIGCGTGRLTFGLVEKAKKVIAVDPIENNIIKAKEKLTKELKDKVVFQVGYGENLEFKDNFFDTVFLGMTLHEIPVDKQKDTLREIKRVLKKGGQLFVIEPLPYGEVQSLYSIFLLKLFNDNHSKRIEHAKKVLEEFIENNLFKLELAKEFKLKWFFNDIDDLCNFFLSEHKISVSNKMYSEDRKSNKIGNMKDELIDKIKNNLKKKLNDKPLIVYDELIFFSLRNIKIKR